jgi:hypothetical protein
MIRNTRKRRKYLTKRFGGESTPEKQPLERKTLDHEMIFLEENNIASLKKRINEDNPNPELLTLLNNQIKTSEDSVAFYKKQIDDVGSINNVGDYKQSETKVESRKSSRYAPLENAVSSSRKSSATRKIQRFLRHRHPMIRGKYLQMICSDSNVCIAFGKESQLIKRHFKGFIHINESDGIVRNQTIIDSGGNGVIIKLTYTSPKSGYKAHAVLKKITDTAQDFILYEAAVGFYLNKFSIYYPVFLETYGLFEVTGGGEYSFKVNNLRDLINGINDGSFVVECNQTQKYELVIQYLENSRTLLKMMSNPIFISNFLLYSLFQIYSTLHFMSSFIHFDLHASNVLIFCPVSKKYIEYIYHLNDNTTVSFKSPYITKIIDYARAFFESDSKLENALKSKCSSDSTPDSVPPLLNEVLRIKQQALRFKSDTLNNNNHLINLNAPDLQLFMYLYIASNPRIRMPEWFDPLFNNVYNDNWIEDDYYLPDPTKCNADKTPICNVSGAYGELLKLVRDPIIQKSNNDFFNESAKLGELHVYENKKTPMRFIEHNPFGFQHGGIYRQKATRATQK